MQFLCISSYLSHESLHFNSSYPVLLFWPILHSLPSNIHRHFSFQYCWSPFPFFIIHISPESFALFHNHKRLPPPPRSTNFITSNIFIHWCKSVIAFHSSIFDWIEMLEVMKVLDGGWKALVVMKNKNMNTTFC